MATSDKLSIANKSLRHKLMIAFSLMAVIPLLACVYLLSPYLMPGFQDIVSLSTVVLAALVVSVLGLIIAWSIINSVIELAVQARKISRGDYDKRIDLPGEDEVVDLGHSINVMTKKIRSSLEELKNYGQSVKEINAEVQKKVTALSSLLQIDDMISAGSMQLDSLLQLGVSKAANIFDMGFGALYIPRAEGDDFMAKVSFNADKEKLTDIVIKRNGAGVLERAVENRKIVHASDDMKLSKDLIDFKKTYNIKNFIAVPLYSDKTVFGLLLIGNRMSDFNYTRDDIDLVTVFAKHIIIAIESDILNQKNKDLAITDDLTGLFNKRYVLIRLEEEIKRAIFYQRPCSFIVLRIDNFKSFRETSGELASEEALKRVAKIIKDNSVPVGRVARISGSEFAMLLPEKNKREASHIAEDVRKKIESANAPQGGKTGLLISVGLGENPIDGATGDELLSKAMTSLARREDIRQKAQ